MSPLPAPPRMSLEPRIGWELSMHPGKSQSKPIPLGRTRLIPIKTNSGQLETPKARARKAQPTQFHTRHSYETQAGPAFEPKGPGARERQAQKPTHAKTLQATIHANHIIRRPFCAIGGGRRRVGTQPVPTAKAMIQLTHKKRPKSKKHTLIICIDSSYENKHQSII